MTKSMLIGGLVLCLAPLSACTDDPPPTTQPVLVTHYASLGPREVPTVFNDTVLQRANIEDPQPIVVSGYGLVTQLRGTGDNSNLPTPVRDYMLKQAQVHRFGSRVAGLERISPEDVLRDKQNAVVRVDGFIPPGARQDDTFDIQVSALEQSYTTSLTHGTLYGTDLRVYGADPGRPGGSVNTVARAAGAVAVNPAYALMRNPTDPTAKQSLRSGLIMDGGVLNDDTYLTVRIRDPQMSTARLIERRVNERYQSVADVQSKIPTRGPIVAAAQDEAIIHLYMPKAFHGDWQHFLGVVKHLYLNGDPGFLALAAQRLAVEAEKPDAPLLNISYALEGTGQAGLPAMRALLKSNKPDVAYAAARAAIFADDDSGEAQQKLREIAATKDHPFRVNAVQTLAALRGTAEVRSDLRKLLNSDNNLVRIEAYRALCKFDDRSLYTKVIRERFSLDLVDSASYTGLPMAYVTRQGLPRIALFGKRLTVDRPLVFSAMDNRLTLSADSADGPVTMFYRGDPARGDYSTTPIVQTSNPDRAEIVARLGGEGAEGEPRFSFSYSEVAAIVQSLAATGRLHGSTPDGQRVPITFIMQDAPAIEDAVLGAPQIPDLSRPQNRDPNGAYDDATPQIPDAAAPTPQPAGPAAPEAPRGRPQ